MRPSSGFPRLLPGEWVVVCAEVATGVICSADGRRLAVYESPYIVFASLVDAEKFAAAAMGAHPELEFAFHDEDGPSVKLWRNEAYLAEHVRKLEVAQREFQRRAEMSLVSRLFRTLRRWWR